MAHWWFRGEMCSFWCWKKRHLGRSIIIDKDGRTIQPFLKPKRVVLRKWKTPPPMLLFSSLWIHIDSLQPHIMGLYLLMVSYLAQSLCKCRCEPHITVACWKTQGFSNHVPGPLIQLPLRRPSLWSVPDLLRVQSNCLASSFFPPWVFPNAAGTVWPAGNDWELWLEQC